MPLARVTATIYGDRLQGRRIAKGADDLHASVGETQGGRRTPRGAPRRTGLAGFRAEGTAGSGLLAATAPTGAAVPSGVGLPVPHRGFLLAVLVAVGVLATVALTSHGSRVTRAGAVPARHRLLTEHAAGAHRSRAPGGLLSLPAAAQAPVSAALGEDEAQYQIHGFVAHNPAQRLVARFGRSGIAVTAGSTRFAIVTQSVRAPERASGARSGFAGGER